MVVAAVGVAAQVAATAAAAEVVAAEVEVAAAAEVAMGTLVCVGVDDDPFMREAQSSAFARLGATTSRVVGATAEEQRAFVALAPRNTLKLEGANHACSAGQLMRVDGRTLGEALLEGAHLGRETAQIRGAVQLQQQWEHVGQQLTQGRLQGLRRETPPSRSRPDLRSHASRLAALLRYLNTVSSTSVASTLAFSSCCFSRALS